MIHIKRRITGEILLTVDADTLARADLYGADLRYADLSGADLRGADLRYADLSGADLSGADLRYADLSGADLSGADLRGTDPCYANLSGTNLRGANLRGAQNIPDYVVDMTRVAPAEGVLRVYKKLQEGVAVLEIPAEAKRSNATGRKCRAEFAKVLELPEGVEVGHSKYDAAFEYRVGEVVRPDAWEDNRWSECAPGIHFFMTREEAEEY